jgi:hypothetical protein
VGTRIRIARHLARLSSGEWRNCNLPADTPTAGRLVVDRSAEPALALLLVLAAQAEPIAKLKATDYVGEWA